MMTSAAKREAVAHLRSAFEMSERRACRTTGCVRMTVRYRPRRPDDAPFRARLRASAHERRPAAALKGGKLESSPDCASTRPALIERFGRTMREQFSTGSVPFRKAICKR